MKGKKFGNPYIKESVRKEVDPHIDEIIKKLPKGKEPETISYVILKLLVKGIGVGVREGILVNGIMSETLQNYNSFTFIPLEKRILLQRWLEPNGEWE